MSAEEAALLDNVEDFLADGLALKRWWDQASATSTFADKFELSRAFNRAEVSFGFFDEVRLARGPLPVMGNYQEMFYDQPRTPLGGRQAAARWMRDQVREFVLRYFMRVSSYRPPEAYAEQDAPAPPFLGGLSWCAREDIRRVGFGFSQLFYKLRETGEVGRFRDEDAHEIIDLRELGGRYEWIVVKVRIFDFKFTLKPFGPGAVEFGLPLAEESYLVLSREFIQDAHGGSRDWLGDYGLGYAFIKSPEQGVLAYGPGDFEAAIELINFRVAADGQVRVRMAFVSNRPERIANVAIDPVDWSFRLANLFSLGMASRFLAPLRAALARIPTSAGTFDPVYTWVAVANALTGDRAARDWCVSREQLEKDFLVRHFMQHYETIAGSLLTWRQIPDWLDRGGLPEWVVRGTSS